MKKLSLLLIIALIGIMMLNSCSFENLINSDEFHYDLLSNGTYAISKKNFKSYTGEIVIPDNYKGRPVTEVSNFSEQTGITGITIPNSVVTINDGAFYNCTNLSSITLPDNLISIGGNATLKGTAYYNNSNNWINGVLYIGNHLVEGRKSGDYTIRDGTKSIAACAFEGSSLSSITIPDSVVSIGHRAFADCENLRNICITNNIISIGSDAFYNTAYYNNENTWINGALYIGNLLIKVDNRSDLYEYKIKNGTVTIADEAFYQCWKLIYVDIPKSVTSIGRSAFSGCSNLTSINIPDSITSISDWAFYDCTSLTSVVIPDSVTSIGFNAFLYCSNLTNLSIPNSVTSIGEGAFNWCESLTSVVIPDSVTFVGERAFQYCKSLKSVTMGKGVTFIASFAFENCNNLKSIVIHNRVTDIGYNAFKGCDNLTDVYYVGTKDEWSKIKFESFNKFNNATIHYNYAPE